MAFIDTAYFGFTITLVAFLIGQWINQKTKNAFMNPLLISIVLIIIVLLVFDIDYEVYNQGGSIISFFLGPFTVLLAVPLYNQIEVLKKSGVSVVVGILVGCFTSVISIYLLSDILGLEEVLKLSLVPKSVTAAISREISGQIGGIPALTVAVTVLTGITGNVIGPMICNLFRIKDRVAVGIALGTTSHAIGTAKAIELGEIEGAMGSLAISVAGLFTVFIAPLVVNFLSAL